MVATSSVAKDPLRVQLDEVGQREASWRRRGWKAGKTAIVIVIVVMSGEVNNEGCHSFYVEEE